jgi:hypothetical protein
MNRVRTNEVSGSVAEAEVGKDEKVRDLRTRLKDYASRIIRLYESLP